MSWKIDDEDEYQIICLEWCLELLNVDVLFEIPAWTDMNGQTDAFNDTMVLLNFLDWIGFWNFAYFGVDLSKTVISFCVKLFWF